MRNMSDIRTELVQATMLQYGFEHGVKQLRPSVNESDEGLAWVIANRPTTMIWETPKMAAIAERAGEIVVASMNIVSAADSRLKVGAGKVHSSFTEAFMGTNDREHSMNVLDATAGQIKHTEDLKLYGQGVVDMVNGTHDEDKSTGLIRAREFTRDAGVTISAVGVATMVIVQNVNEYLARNDMEPLPPKPAPGQ
jgi:protein tyrosine phosphatase (PTP) superfamily phosphohydrolase (DUF442 family)